MENHVLTKSGFLNVVAALAISWICGFLFMAQAEPFSLVSQTSAGSGIGAGGDADSTLPVVSANDRYVLFSSAANNLVSLSSGNPLSVLTPPQQNIYLRDRIAGSTVLISVGLATNTGASRDAVPIAISTNGQFALFESAATNLVANVTNGFRHIFYRDVINNFTLAVDTNLTGYREFRDSVMTPGGRYVSFVGVSNGITDIFVRDMQSNLTTRITAGTAGGGLSDLPDLTPDGHYVAFYSTATNVVAGVQTPRELYVRNLVTGTTVWATAYAHTAVSNIYGSTNCVSFGFCLSDDGQYLAYETTVFLREANALILRYNLFTGVTDLITTNAVSMPASTDLTAHNLDMSADGRYVAYLQLTNSGSIYSYVYVWDSQTGVSTLASGDTNNLKTAYSICSSPALNATGSHVSFIYSGSSSLTSNTVNGGFHLYERDLVAGITRLVDVDTNGAGSLANFWSAGMISDSGSSIVFDASQASLTTNGVNPFADVFLYSTATNSNEIVSGRQAEFPSTGLTGSSAITPYGINSNGNILVFATSATNAAPGLTNGPQNIFIRNISAGTNSLVSVDATGLVQGSGASTDASISPDGRYVSFSSFATNLTSLSSNSVQNIYLRDLVLGSTALVSVNTDGTATGNANSSASVVSSDGRRVLFHSFANNLANGVSATNYDNVYVRDLQTGKTFLLLTNASSTNTVVGAMTPDGHFAVTSVNTSAANLYIWNLQTTNVIYTNITLTLGASALSISPDGTHIAYISVHASSGGVVYAIDRNSNTVTALKSGPLTFNPQIRARFSADSRYMTFVGLDNLTTNQIYVYDFQTHSNILVSHNTASFTNGGNRDSLAPDITADGRYVVYVGLSTNLVSGITPAYTNVYLWDRTSGDTTLLSVSQLGNFPATGRTTSPVLSGDGYTLFVQSTAQDLATNGYSFYPSIYALSLAASGTQSAFPLSIVPSSAGSLTLSWPAVAIKNYQVQYKTNLASAAWSILNIDVTIVGNQATAIDSSPVSPRFYRVVGF